MFKRYSKMLVMWLTTLIASLIISATHQNVMTPTFRNTLAASSFLVLFISLVCDFFKRARETSKLTVKVVFSILAVLLLTVTIMLIMGCILDSKKSV